jgi:hypothetical protein
MSEDGTAVLVDGSPDLLLPEPRVAQDDFQIRLIRVNRRIRYALIDGR